MSNFLKFALVILGLFASNSALAKIENPMTYTEFKFAGPILLKFDSYLRFPSNTKGRERFTINYSTKKILNGSTCEISHEYQLTDKDENYADLEKQIIASIQKKSPKVISIDNSWRTEYSRFTMNGFYLNLVRASYAGNAKKLVVKCSSSSAPGELNSQAAIARGQTLLKQLGLVLTQTGSPVDLIEPVTRHRQHSPVFEAPVNTLLVSPRI